ncbi:MAG: TlpA disulfide reductase family protein [Chthoniobacteraceae bacterium]|jgi:hypothetical protein
MTSRACTSLCAAACLSLAAPASVRADANGDWRQIQAMETSAPTSDWSTSEDMRAVTVGYLGRQEQALRAFIVAYPADIRIPDAKLRLAHLLATLGDLEQDPALRAQSMDVLNQLERDPSMKDRRADVEFARLSLFMERADASTTNRDILLEKSRAFAKQFPNDRRLAALLAEVASAFDDEPPTARSLLGLAQPAAKTPELRARIDDDLKRLSLVGKPLDMTWVAVDGSTVDLKSLRGRVVLIYFFATWSAPSMYALDWVRGLGAGSGSVARLGICLDNDPVSVPDMLTAHSITYPVYCDGEGWHGKLVRGLGINSLPALWIVDRDGILLTIDAKDDAQSIIEKAVPIGDSGE